MNKVNRLSEGPCDIMILTDEGIYFIMFFPGTPYFSVCWDSDDNSETKDLDKDPDELRVLLEMVKKYDAPNAEEISIKAEVIDGLSTVLK